ncbi:MAG: hypothetical protein JHD35_13570 [Sphingopyxis sp.]|nr:hypothetical protein [Sphingopyxis sp.]
MPSLSRRQVVAGAAAVAAAAGTAGFVGFAAEPSPAPPSGPLPMAALKADLAVWRRAVLERHPRYYGQTMLEAPVETAFRTAAASIEGALTREQAFRLFARINPTFRDAHTLLLPWLSGEEPGGAERASQFPFGADIAPDGRLRLRSSWRNETSGETLAQGTEILAINGLATPDLLARLLAYSHGETPKLRMHMLSVMLPGWLDAAMGWRDRFAITLAGAAAPTTLQWTKGARWAPVENSKAAEMPRVEWLGADAALLRVPTFDVDEAPDAYNAAIDQAFAAINARHTQRLIIDVRGNTGGQSDAGARVIQYVLNRPAAQVSRARERLNDENNGVLGYRGATGSMREFVVDDELIQPVPADARFKGRVAVLIDELTYSAGILFATTMQDRGLATLVGRPTGGFANQTGNMMPTRLPATGFTAFIATRDFIRPSGDRRVAPVQPDIIVNDSASEAMIVRTALDSLAKPAGIKRHAETPAG